MILPPEEEWRFSAIEDAEVWACFVYECHREALRCDFSGRLAEEARKMRGGDGGFRSSLPLLLVRLLGAGAPADMEAPWSRLKDSERAGVAREFEAPPARPVLHANFDGIARLETPDSLAVREVGPDGKVRVRTTTVEEFRKGLMGRIRTVPFFLPPGLSRSEMVSRFDQWLQENPEWVAGAKTGRERRKWTPREALRYLGARRLAKACGGARELAGEAEANDLVARELARPKCAVPGEAEVHRMIRKADALVEAAARGGLRDFRMSA